MVRGYNASEADRYFCEPPEPCEPKLVELDEYNCNYCDDDTCPNYYEYNYIEKPTMDKFDIDCERYHQDC